MESGHRPGWIREERESLLEIGMKESGKMERDMVFLVMEGFGVFYYANGTKYMGFWSDN